MRWRRTDLSNGLGLLLGLSAWLLMPAPSLATPALQTTSSALVYRCGNDFENLCRFTFDGAPPRRLTNDGQPAGPLYASPSLSADGTKLAFTFGNDVFIGDRDAAHRSDRFARRTLVVALRPDGKRLATIEPIPEATSVHGPGYYLCGHQLYACSWNPEVQLPGFVNYLFTYDAGGGDKQTERRQPTAFAWDANRILSDDYDAGTRLDGVCVLVVGDYKCERNVARDPKRSLTTPAVSPDGGSLAVTACTANGTQESCAIALYALPGGAFVRDVSPGPDDTVPVWSPDGSRLAFSRGQSIWVIDRDGARGTERLLIDHGIQATWGGFAGNGAGPAPNPAAEPNPAPGSSSPPAAVNLNFADELTDWGVPPQDVLQANVGSRTPTTIPGGQVATTVDVARAMANNVPVILIDALGDTHRLTIRGAVRLPDAGQPGAFDDQIQDDLAAALDTQTDGNMDAALIFFCQGSQCWESYNASLRAINLGYTNVSWYRGGLGAWAEARLPLE